MRAQGGVLTNVSKHRLIQVSLVLAIGIVVAGLWWYSQGPVPYSITLIESNPKDYSLKAGKWTYGSLEFPTGRVHSKFAFNMTISMGFSFAEGAFDVFLLNETQFTNWNSSQTDYVLKTEFPNYNFSLEVKPDDYFLAIDGTHLEKDCNVSTFPHIEVVAQNFDYGRVWPGLYLILAGLVIVNMSVVLMKRERMFGKLDAFFEKMCQPWVSLPQKSSKDYLRYRVDLYRKFIKPLYAFCFMFVPIAFVPFIVLKMHPRSTSPFTSVAWDYVLLTVITWYFLLLAIFAVFIVVYLFMMPRSHDLSLILSRKLGLLRAADTDKYREVGSLVLAKIRERKSIIIFAGPIVLLFVVLLIWPGISVQPDRFEASQILWIFFGILFSYYGLAMSYFQSRAIQQIFRPTRRVEIARYRKNELLRGVIMTSVDILSFFIVCSVAIILLFYGWIPITSSSLAVKFGLTSVTTWSITEFSSLLFRFTSLVLLLAWSFFYGITGYAVPTLLEKGVKSPIVASVALVLAFFTERTLSLILEPYLKIDWALSLLFSFSIFVLVLIFERFYRRVLQEI